MRRCVEWRESRGDPTVQNPSSGASGLHGWLRSTWLAVTGLPGDAKDYSVAIQRAAFYKLFANGKGKAHWAMPEGSKKGCW